MTAARGYDAVDDAALLALVREHDGAALLALYARYGPVCYALARRVTGRPDTAEQVVEDVFRALWDGQPLDGGLVAATHQRAVDALRRAPEHRGPVASGEVAGDLPDDERTALALAYFGGYTQREIAALTGTTAASARALMLAGLRGLAAATAEPGRPT